MGHITYEDNFISLLVCINIVNDIKIHEPMLIEVKKLSSKFEYVSEILSKLILSNYQLSVITKINIELISKDLIV